MAVQEFDIIILGGGNAAMGVTVATSAAGMSIAMVEPWALGGTCSNRGCTPKKVLVAAAHALHEIEQAGTHKIDVGKPTLDWSALIEREKDLIADLPQRFEQLMLDRGITLFRRDGRFTGPNEVVSGDDILRGKHIVIATGSRHRDLPIPGAELMITSDDVLSEPQQPQNVVFIGGGVVAFEFSHVYARAGTKVTILELAPRFLGRFDPDAVAAVCRESERIGIDMRAGVSVHGLERAGDRLRVRYEENGIEKTIEADRVINGAGRVPNIDKLDLTAGQVDVERGTIKTDGHFRSTSNPAVFAGGDALSGKPQLSPIATHEGRMIGRMIASGQLETFDYAPIPAALFTVPTLAMVGMTEAEAEDTGHDISVHDNDLSGWFSARTNGETAAFSKIIVDQRSGHVLGAHIVGHNAGDLIHLFALAIRHGITASDIQSMIFAFPTYAADVPSML
ncbi:MAG: dihydrolipoyl dehydrogenase family protein [Alphaproteobacteria bacterium]